MEIDFFFVFIFNITSFLIFNEINFTVNSDIYSFNTTLN